MNDSEKAREKFVLKEIDQSFGDCCFWARQGWNAAVEWCKTKSPKRPTAGVGAESRCRACNLPLGCVNKTCVAYLARAESPSTAAEEKA